MGNWVLDNKGVGPWSFKKGEWPTMNPPWSADSPNRPTYNEGNRISSYDDPTWPMDEFTGDPITETHDPCGYWLKDYVPPSPPAPFPGLYQYSVYVGGTRYIRIISLKNYNIIKDIPLLDVECFPPSGVGVVRVNNEGREAPYTDSESNVYLMAEAPASDPYKFRVIKFNLIDYSLSYLSITATDNGLGFVDGYVVGNNIYFIKCSAYDNKKVYVINLNSFTAASSFGKDVVQPGRPGILVDDRVYCLDYRYEPYYSKVTIWSLEGTYITTINIAPGWPSIYSKAGFVRSVDYVYFLSYYSETSGVGDGRLCRFSLPNVDDIHSVVLPHGFGCHMCINSSMTKAYVLSTSHIYRYTLPNFTLADSIELGGTYTPEGLSMCLDETVNKLYVGISGIDYPFRVYFADPLVLDTIKTHAFAKSMFVVRN